MASVAEREARVKSRLIDSVARVDLRVRDVENALSFYRDVVGLSVTNREEDRAELGTPNGTVFLTLDSTGVTEPADPGATGLFHTAFRFPTRPDLGDALARLALAQFEIGAGDHIVSEALYIDDPDGNGVELYWDRPLEEWPAPTNDMLVPMATLPVDLESLLQEGRGEQAANDPAPNGTDIGHVHLQVSEVGQTVDFYSKVLGLDLTARMGGSAGFFSSKGYHHNIGANAWRSRGGKAAPKNKAGLERVVFGVTEPSELESLHARLQEAGHDVVAGENELVITDPDGLEIRFALQ